jgi:hypothetical protein
MGFGGGARRRHLPQPYPMGTTTPSSPLTLPQHKNVRLLSPRPTILTPYAMACVHFEMKWKLLKIRIYSNHSFTILNLNI